jgi:hypothetical protein
LSSSVVVSHLFPLAVVFPYGVGSFEGVFRPGFNTFNVDKSHFLAEHEVLGVGGELPPAVSSLCPRRFVKTFGLDMTVQYYDLRNKEKFPSLFGHLAIGKEKTKLAHSFMVLKFT